MASDSSSQFFWFFKRHYILAAFLVVAIAGSTFAFAMSNKTETYSWRYKMTVDVDTPEGIKTGSAVREVVVEIKPFLLDKRKPWRSYVHVRGEAVVVDLGNRGKLFTLLDGDDAYRIVFTTFPYNKGGLTPEGASYYSKLKADPQSIKQIPTMVTFKNIKNPTSLEVADRNNLSNSFGSGVKLENVTIEMTNDAVTKNIRNIIPPFNAESGFLEWYKGLNFSDPRRFDRSYFERSE